MLERAPQLTEHLGDDARRHFERVQAGLDCSRCRSTAHAPAGAGLRLLPEHHVEFASTALDAAQHATRRRGTLRPAGRGDRPSIVSWHRVRIGVERVLIAADAEQALPADRAGVDVFVVDGIGGPERQPAGRRAAGGGPARRPGLRGPVREGAVEARRPLVPASVSWSGGARRRGARWGSRNWRTASSSRCPASRWPARCERGSSRPAPGRDHDRHVDAPTGPATCASSTPARTSRSAGWVRRAAITAASCSSTCATSPACCRWSATRNTSTGSTRTGSAPVGAARRRDRAAPPRRHGQPRPRHPGHRGDRPPGRAPQPGRTAADPDQRPSRGRRDVAARYGTWTCASSRCDAFLAMRDVVNPGPRGCLDRGRLHRGLDADADRLDPRGRPGLRGPVTAEPRRVLRPSPEPAAAQAGLPWSAASTATTRCLVPARRGPPRPTVSSSSPSSTPR